MGWRVISRLLAAREAKQQERESERPLRTYSACRSGETESRWSRLPPPAWPQGGQPAARHWVVTVRSMTSRTFPPPPSPLSTPRRLSVRGHRTAGRGKCTELLNSELALSLSLSLSLSVLSRLKSNWENRTFIPPSPFQKKTKTH